MKILGNRLPISLSVDLDTKRGNVTLFKDATNLKGYIHSLFYRALFVKRKNRPWDSRVSGFPLSPSHYRDMHVS